MVTETRMENDGSCVEADCCSVVIPVYGNGECLPILVKRLDTAFQASGMNPPELVLVNDCGPGDGWGAIQRVTSSRPATTAVQLMRNFGQHNALMCGFRHATGDVVVTMDDDLQHEPECVPALVGTLKERNVDVVYGVYDHKKHTGGRNLGSRLVNWFYRIVFRLAVDVTSFRAMRRELIDAVLRYELNFTYIDGLIAWNTTRIACVEVPHRERLTGRSGYTLGKLATLGMNVFTNFSLLPLQAVSVCGVIAALGGLLLGVWFLIAALLAKIAVPGYASTIVAVLVLGGLQLLSLGVIGEYIGRLHLNVNRKPQYTVRHVVSYVDASESDKGGEQTGHTRVAQEEN